MSYTIRYSTKGGGSGMTTVLTNERAKDVLLSLFKTRQSARVEKNGLTIGEVYKTDRKWQWYIDTEA